jgi:hypothetical protein
MNPRILSRSLALAVALAALSTLVFAGEAREGSRAQAQSSRQRSAQQPNAAGSLPPR